MIRASGSPEQNCGSRSWETQEGFREGWGPGACSVRWSWVLEDEAKSELQEESRAGTDETREDLLEELRAGKRYEGGTAGGTVAITRRWKIK